MEKLLDGIQQMGGYVNKPKLIGTFNYSDFTVPSASKNKLFTGVLSRNARQRTYIFNNTLNQAMTAAPSYYMYDSTLMNGAGAYSGSTSFAATLAANSNLLDTSERIGTMAAHVDSILIVMPIGPTLPTSGKIDIYVSEYF
jgi:hypothetical protein